MRGFLDQAQALVPAEMRPRRLPGDERSETPSFTPSELRITPQAIADALRFIPNDDLDYDSWVRIGMALKGALGDNNGWDLFAA